MNAYGGAVFVSTCAREIRPVTCADATSRGIFAGFWSPTHLVHTVMWTRRRR